MVDVTDLGEAPGEMPHEVDLDAALGDEDVELADDLELEEDVDDEVDENVDLDELSAAAEADDEDDEVEASLDEILLVRLGGVDAEPEPDDDAAPEPPPVDDDGIAPRRSEEFVCQSCFLIRRHCLLTDPVRRLCADCAPADAG